MPSTRPKLILDEQAFQGLLAAAFTIQQYNDRQNNARQNQDRPNNNRQVDAGPGPTRVTEPNPQPNEVCRHCGATLPIGVTPCPSCGAENLRPGERLQRTWASMWMMSQEQGFSPEPRENAPIGAPPLPPQPRSNGHEPADSRAADFPSSGHASLLRQEIDLPPSEIAHPGEPPGASKFPVSSTALSAGGNSPSAAPSADAPAALADTTIPSPARSRFSNAWAKLRSHRADLYLGIAVLVAAIALLWPAATLQRSKLHAWERILIAMGLAEPPASVVHYRGDPNLKVWVDTHTALYYCPGDELYGKSPDGHFSTQREAQSDQFEPAERSACVE